MSLDTGRETLYQGFADVFNLAQRARPMQWPPENAGIGFRDLPPRASKLRPGSLSLELNRLPPRPELDQPASPEPGWLHRMSTFGPVESWSRLNPSSCIQVAVRGSIPHFVRRRRPAYRVDRNFGAGIGVKPALLHACKARLWLQVFLRSADHLLPITALVQVPNETQREVHVPDRNEEPLSIS